MQIFVMPESNREVKGIDDLRSRKIPGGRPVEGPGVDPVMPDETPEHFLQGPGFTVNQIEVVFQRVSLLLQHFKAALPSPIKIVIFIKLNAYSGEIEGIDRKDMEVHVRRGHGKVPVKGPALSFQRQHPVGNGSVKSHKIRS